jgi:hypothetical protein
MEHLLCVLPPSTKADRTWCGNDDTSRFRWDDRIPLKNSPVSIHLSWISKKGALEQYIGTFLLHFPALLAGGYVKEEGSDSVRVRFRNDDGIIKLSPRKGAPEIVVGVRSN